MKRVFIVLALVAIAGIASGATVSYTDSVSFTSDLEAPAPITLPTFDSTDTTGCQPGEWNQLQNVAVTFTFSGSADIAGDNDDDFQGATMNARIIRNWVASGPGSLFGLGQKTIQSPSVAVTADDGDDGAFDATSPDGHAFGVLAFSNEPGVGNASLPLAAYTTAGPGTVDITVTPSTMVNDLQFVVNPDAWQLEVQNPIMTIEATVTYTYECVPEPATMGLLALGGLGLIRRRFA